MKNYFCVIFLMVFLSSCFGGAGNMPITETMIDGTEKIVGNITDASVQKEYIANKTVQNQDNKIAASNAKPSFELTWTSVEETAYYPGMKEPIVIKKTMPNVKYTEKQAFTQVRSQTPSEHPAWKYMTDLGKTVVQFSFYGWLSNGLFDMVEKGWSMVGSKHIGDNYQSGNGGDGIGPVTSTAQPYVFGAEALSASPVQ